MTPAVSTFGKGSNRLLVYIGRLRRTAALSTFARTPVWSTCIFAILNGYVILTSVCVCVCVCGNVIREMCNDAHENEGV